MSGWNDEYVIIIPENKRTIANALATGWYPGTPNTKPFDSLPMSASAQEPVTHRCTQMRANQALKGRIQAFESALPEADIIKMDGTQTRKEITDSKNIFQITYL